MSAEIPSQPPTSSQSPDSNKDSQPIPSSPQVSRSSISPSSSRGGADVKTMISSVKSEHKRKRDDALGKDKPEEPKKRKKKKNQRDSQLSYI